MDIKETVKAGYDAAAPNYLETRTKDSQDVRLLRELLERLPPEAKVLDAGCGAGVPVARFLSQRCDVTGVDFSETQIQLARQLVPQARFLCQDITHLTFPSNSFDAICSYYAIIHVPRQEHRALLLKFEEILKPSGLVLLCLGAEDDEYVTDDYLGTGARMCWSHYDAETNLRMLRDCGFEVIWSKVVSDDTFDTVREPGPGHLFVLAQKRAV